MIIYGTRAVHLRSAQSKTATCPSCKTKGSILISVFRRHVHMFWIPLFPIRKSGVSQCQHCKHLLKTKQMPESIKNEYINLNNKTKGPLWQFAGLGLFAILVFWIRYSGSVNEKHELDHISSPSVGDVYNYQIEFGSYSTLKVMSVSSDSVIVSPNKYEINKRSQSFKIDKSENYSDTLYGISKNKLKEMYSSGEIYYLIR